MYLKKAICGLMSVSILAGCTCCPISAESVEKILASPSVLRVDELRTLIEKYGFNKFIIEEKSKLSRGPYYIEDVHHLDSIMFWCLCVLLYKNDLSKYIERIVESRYWPELERDSKAFKHERKEIIEKLEKCFGVTVTDGELKALYSSIMNKSIEVEVKAGRYISYTHVVPRKAQLISKKIERKPSWQKNRRKDRIRKEALLDKI